jgi:hypothetical protein
VHQREREREREKEREKERKKERNRERKKRERGIIPFSKTSAMTNTTKTIGCWTLVIIKQRQISCIATPVKENE